MPSSTESRGLAAGPAAHAPATAEAEADREIRFQYSDPVDLIWLTTAHRLGIRVERSDEVFASWDGRGTLYLGSARDLDPDDCLAQMIFHELCHALVQGPESVHQLDWGLHNQDARDLTREHACNRLQAALAAPHGLRELLAVTTSWRSYYDALPDDPLAEDGDPAAALARTGWTRAMTGPWATHIAQALEATALVARATQPFSSPDSIWQIAGAAPHLPAPLPIPLRPL